MRILAVFLRKTQNSENTLRFSWKSLKQNDFYWESLCEKQKTAKKWKNALRFSWKSLKIMTFTENPCARSRKAQKSVKTITFYMKKCKNEALLLRILVRKRKLDLKKWTATSPPGVATQMTANRFVSFSVPLFETQLEPYRVNSVREKSATFTDNPCARSKKTQNRENYPSRKP